MKLRFLLTAATCVAASAVHAATDTWNASVNTTWDTVTQNWISSASPAAFANGDDVVFGAVATNTAITLGGPVSAADIFSNGPTATPGTMTITGLAGNALTLGTGTVGTGDISDLAGTGTGYAGNLTYSSANTTAGTFFQLAAGSGTSVTPVIWNIASGKTLLIQSKVNNDTADLGGDTVNLTGLGIVKFATNGGALIVRNGTFNVNAGSLQLLGASNGFSNFQSTLAVNVAAGANLTLTPNSGGANVSYNEVVTLNGGTLQNGSGGVGGNGVQTGAVTVGTGASTVSSQSGGNFTLKSLSGSGAVTFTSLNAASGTLINGVSTFSGTATINTNSTLRLTTGAELGAGTLTLSAGSTLTANGATAITVGNAIAVSGASTFNFGDATNTGKVTLTQGLNLGGTGKTFSVATGASAEFSGVVSNSNTSGTLTKAGAGSLTLSGVNTYNAPTTVSAGSLVTGNVSALGTGAVAVNNGGTLTIGNGTVNTVTAVGAVTVASGGVLKFAAAGSSIAQSATNGFMLTNGFSLDLSNAFNAANTYTLLTSSGAGNSVGTYTLLNADTTNYNFAFAVSGSNAVLTVTAVPEPSTYGLIGAGTLAAVAFVRRRRKAAGQA